MTTIEAFAPGRLCLFGEHQDYLGLAVLALAIDRGVRVRLTPNGSRELAISLPDVGAREVIPIDGSAPPRHPRDWLRTAVTELVAAGARLPSGADVEVCSDLPVNAGCGSSSALVVAFLGALARFADADPLAEPRRLAELAWNAEVGRAGGPGGRMDHLASAVGGLVHLNFGPTPFVQELKGELDGFVLIESGEAKETSDALAALRARARVEAAFATLRAVTPSLELAAISFDATWNLLLDASAANGAGESAADRAAREQVVFATLFNRDLLLAALRFLAEPKLDRLRIGELLDEHHRHLRDGLALSTPRIEVLRTAALAAGALGAKLNGSGGGGSLFAYAPGAEAAVVAAMGRLGARATVVRRSAGVSITASA